MENMAQLCLEASLPPAAAAMQKSTISYYPPFEDSAPILISESPQLLAAGSNVGFRTWDACLRLAYFLCTENQSLIKNKKIIELGAGTGMLSILCANHLGAESVLATDGNTEVVASMKENISLNSDDTSADSDTVKAAHFDWADSDTLTQALGISGIEQCPKYDLILGADITYNPEYFEPLVSALELLLAVNQHASILIAGAIRNINTYNTFLDTCTKNRLEVLEVEYQCPPLHQQKGFFHAIAFPIKIMHIRRETAPKGV
jgi:protein-lysine N-methyltransferase EEF2KMT